MLQNDYHCQKTAHSSQQMARFSTEEAVPSGAPVLTGGSRPILETVHFSSNVYGSFAIMPMEDGSLGLANIIIRYQQKNIIIR
jgi:hypothetical protein